MQINNIFSAPSIPVTKYLTVKRPTLFHLTSRKWIQAKDLMVNVYSTLLLYTPDVQKRKKRERKQIFKTIFQHYFNGIGDAEKMCLDPSSNGFGSIWCIYFYFLNKIALIYTWTVHEELLLRMRCWIWECAWSGDDAVSKTNQPGGLVGWLDE